MLKLFEYNWQVRQDWFDWCESVPEEELSKIRTGGVRSFLYTLYHIVAVEYGWVSGLQGKWAEIPGFEECASLPKIMELSALSRKEIAPFLSEWNSGIEDRILIDQDENGQPERLKYGEVIRHVIAHEIHHIGQLSVWSREIGREPVTANFIRRGLYEL